MRAATAITALLTVVVTSLVVPVPTAAAAQTTSPGSWESTCSARALGLGGVTVDLAPGLPGERRPDGGRVEMTSDARGRYVPVVMVHGWTGRGTHTPERRGSFSHLIDLAANPTTRDVPRSLIGQLQGVPGAAVFTYDYHRYSGRWVDDPYTGRGLGKVIDCLHRESGEKVIVVAHSMGGLMTRFAAAEIPGRADRISSVVTFGTPHQGSIAAMLTAGAIDGSSGLYRPVAVLRALLAACGKLDVESGTFCDALPDPVQAFSSDAGIALRYGSRQLAALAPFPRGIAVTALAGDTRMRVPGGWFGRPWATEEVGVGDVIVTTGSALPAGAAQDSAECAYQLNAVRGATDVVGLLFGHTARSDVAEQPLRSFSGPCMHTSLMRGAELTVEALAVVAEDIGARQPVVAADLLVAPVPAACTQPAGRLEDGLLPGINRRDGVMGLSWISIGIGDAENLSGFGDLTGDGRGDAAAVLYCDAGGVSWPQRVALYDRGPTLLGHVDLSDITAPGVEPGSNTGVSSLVVRDGAVEVTWVSQQGGDAAATSSIDYTAVLQWDGRRVVVRSLSHVTEVETARRFASAIIRDDTATATELTTRPAQILDALEFADAFPGVFDRPPTCDGTISFDLPAPVEPLVTPGGAQALEDIDRVCMFRHDGGRVVVLGMLRVGVGDWDVHWARAV